VIKKLDSCCAVVRFCYHSYLIGLHSVLFTLLMHRSWGPFLESPETFRAHFGRHNSLFIFKTKAPRGTKLASYFNIYSLYNISKTQLYKIGGLEFYEWLFGSGKFSGLSRNGPLGSLIVKVRGPSYGHLVQNASSSTIQNEERDRGWCDFGRVHKR